MKHTPYQEIELKPFSGEDTRGAGIRWLISERDGAENFAMRMIELEPGGYSPRHCHPGEHEIFVWKGTGELQVGGRSYPLRPGIAAFVPGGTEHQFINTSPDQKLEFICVIPLAGK